LTEQGLMILKKEQMDLITNLNLKLPQAGYIPKEEKATKR